MQVQRFRLWVRVRVSGALECPGLGLLKLLWDLGGLQFRAFRV